MKKYIYIAAIMLIGPTAVAYGAGHHMGPNNECFYDTNYNKYWHYYYCGNMPRGCDGKKGNGNDVHHTLYDGQKFTFPTGDHEPYYCCGGTQTTKGKFVYGANFYVDTKTTVKDLGNGAKCNQLTRTTICGETEFTDCNTPETCSQGRIMRNSECVTPCEGDDVFESNISNKCTACDERHTGPVMGTDGYRICKRCDKDTEFFDRANKVCVSKSSLVKYSKQDMRACWRCKNSEIMLACMQSRAAGTLKGLYDNDLLDFMDSFGKDLNIEKLSDLCHLRPE